MILKHFCKPLKLFSPAFAGFDLKKSIHWNKMKKTINVLIIEEDRDDFLLVEHHLKQQGLNASCRWVTTLTELIEAIGTENWDVILSDHNLPTLDFEEICSTCQNRLPEIPLILVSEWLGEEKAIELLRRGIRDFVFKDNLTLLAPTIERSLREAEDHRDRLAAKAALLESEVRYRTLFENAQDGMALAETATGLLVDCNPALCQLVERSKEEIVGQPQSTLHPPQDLIEGLSPTYRKHLQNPSGTVLVDSLLSKSGRIIPVEIRGSQLQIKGRNYILGVFRDITEPQQAEIEKENSRSFLDGIIEQSPTPMWISDMKGTMIRINKACCALLRVKPEEVIGKYNVIADNIVEDQGYMPLVQSVFREGKTVNFDLVYDSNNLKILPLDQSAQVVLNVTIFPIRDSMGKITHAIIQHIDITERKQAEDQLRNQEATLRGVLDATQESIWLFSTDGRVLMANETALKRYGKPGPEVIGKPLENLPKDLARSRWARMREAVQSGRPVEFEDRRGEMDFHHTFYPVIDGEGRVSSVVAFSRDISEHKKTVESLEASLEEKVILLKEVHHRVKNNLQIVASLLGLQVGRSKSPEMIEVLKDMRNRVKSIALLHETLYRSENLGHINFADYIKGLCGQLLYSSGPVANRIRLEYQVVPINLPLEQAVPCGLIVSELVSNALKHGFPGDRAGRIQIELIPIEEKTILLSVRDEGLGLPSDFKLDTSPGLGLKLVSGLTDQLGGILEMETAPGKGADFRITFLLPRGALDKGVS
jgi:PAS domain S-box-containing protein